MALVAAGGVFVVGFIAMGFHAAINDKGPEQKPSDTGANSIAQVTPMPPVPPVTPIVQAAAEPPKLIYVQPPPAAPAAPAPPSVVSGPANYVVFPAGASGEGFFEVAPPAASTGKDASGDHNGDRPQNERAGHTEVAFKPSTIGGGKAGPAIHMTYVMRPQIIPCALDTAMDSTVAGPFMCHTTQEVLSQDHVLLLPAGSQIVGSYKNDVKSGQNRLFAFSGSVLTEEGIPVPLDSQISDGMGRAGIEGEVDNHYVQRFGAAITLSLADSLLGIAQAMASKEGQTSLNLNSGSGVGGVANQILQSQINIPPTIYVQPGTIVGVFVDHPIDFSDAIKVGTR